MHGTWRDTAPWLFNTYFAPAIAPANVVAEKQSFSDVSPQFAFGYRVAPKIGRAHV